MAIFRPSPGPIHGNDLRADWRIFPGGGSVFGLLDFRALHPHHVKDEEAGCKLMPFSRAQCADPSKGKYQASLSLFDRLKFEPDVIIAHGQPGQVGRIAKAFTWHGETVLRCILAVWAVYRACTRAAKPVICIRRAARKCWPGPMTQMSIVFPAARLDDVLTGFEGTSECCPTRLFTPC